MSCLEAPSWAGLGYPGLWDVINTLQGFWNLDFKLVVQVAAELAQPWCDACELLSSAPVP